MKVLIVEDNDQVVRDISFCLQVRYPEVVVVSVAEWQNGLDMIETESPDLVMVDSSLPNVNILDLVSQIRGFSDVPLISLYDTATDMDRAMCLETGADECISKPFSPIELLARVKALLRRTEGIGFKQDHSISAGKLKINTGTQEVFLSGKRVKLTPIEYHLLLELVRNNGRVLTNSTLIGKGMGLRRHQ